MTEHWYRYTDYHGGTSVTVTCERYRVTKTTPCGVWLDVWGEPKWVRRSAYKRWACPTRDEALTSYYARKRRQVGILKARLKDAEAALAWKPGEKTQSDEEVWCGLQNWALG